MQLFIDGPTLFTSERVSTVLRGGTAIQYILDLIPSVAGVFIGAARV